jgi:hypothetical protein
VCYKFVGLASHECVLIYVYIFFFRPVRMDIFKVLLIFEPDISAREMR